MKLPLKFKKLAIGKKTIIGASLVLAVGAVTGVAALNSAQNAGATDAPPLVQQVDNNTKELANHDARISNSESDIKNLQNNTNTPPSSNKVSVPDATPASNPASTPTVTVASFEKIQLDATSIDCKYTYSDGTTYQWHWQTAGQDSWVTDGVGQNGHWVHTLQTSGACDQSAIGQPKAN